MSLPFNAPIQPMLSSAAEGLPAGDGWLFEPKWDGFRTLVFRDGDEILLQSRDDKPMNRYFPELVEPLRRALAVRCVVDGEVVIVGAGGQPVGGAGQHGLDRRVERQAHALILALS